MNARTLILAALAGIALVAGLVLTRGPDDGPAAPTRDTVADAAPAEISAADVTRPGTPAAGTAAAGTPAAELGDRADVGSPADRDASAPAGQAGLKTPEPGAGAPSDARAGGSEASSSEAPSSEASSSAQDPVAEILRATSARYEDVRALQADFEQQLTNTLLGRTTRSAGTLYQRQPDRFLMRFSDPAGDVIVSDGEYFWLYYPSVDPKQVIRTARGAGGLDLRSQFVGDPVRRFEAESHGRETVRGRATHVLTLTPREPMGYRSLKVWIDAEDHLVRRFELREENGNVRRFDLTDLRINPTLGDALFEFDPPPGAVVVTR